MRSATETVRMWLANDYDLYHGARYACRTADDVEDAAPMMEAFVDGLLAPVLDVGVNDVVVGMMRDLMNLGSVDWHEVVRHVTDIDDDDDNDDSEE